MQKAQTLVVDIDGVIGDLSIPILRTVSRRRGFTIPKSRLTCWDYRDADINIPEEINLFFAEPANLQRVPLVPGAREGLKAASKHLNILIVTARHPACEAATRYWLLNHGIRYPLLHKWRKHEVPGDILVDDRPENCEAWAKTGRYAYLFTQPWNAQAVTDDLVRRVSGWEQMSRILGGKK